MINISYTESFFLKQAIKRIDLLRQNILLEVIAPNDEISLRWQSTIERVYWTFSLTNSQLSRNDIAKILRDIQTKPFDLEKQQVLNYKRALDYISHHWLSTKKMVNLEDVINLNGMLEAGKLNIKADALKNSLSYFNNSNEHPVILAGLVNYLIFSLSPINNRNTRFSNLLSYLFFYKQGFDFRGILVFEEYFRRNFTDYQLLLENTEKSGTQTLWLEFFTKAVITSLERSLERLVKDKIKFEAQSAVFNLNQRQKEILSFLDNPDANITNREVQKIFKVSQITASRDLAKLASMLLIFTHGKGRSVYYTRI